MSLFTKCLRSGACVAIGALAIALGNATDVQGCHGGGGGCSRGGGGGYYGGGGGGGYYGGGGYSGGYSNGGTSGYQGQNPSSANSSNSSSTQQSTTNGTRASVNNPATALANGDVLDLTADQVKRLEKMAASGKQHAALVLTTAQKKALAQIISPARKTHAKAAAQKQSSEDNAAQTTAN